MSEQNDNPTFDLQLDLNTINQLLSVLGEHPYNKSAGFISLIMRQVQPQIAKIQADRLQGADSTPPADPT